jgi:type IV secretory pathway VirB2 component (pilin)
MQQVEQGRRAVRQEGRGQGRKVLPALLLLAVAALILLPASAYAQGSPWENAVNVLMVSFTGPIARGLSLVSIVVGGVTFAFGEGGSKRLLAGIVFGVGMAIGAVNFMSWLFP